MVICVGIRRCKACAGEFLDKTTQSIEHQLDEFRHGLARNHRLRGRDYIAGLRIHNARQRPAFMFDGVAALNQAFRPSARMAQVFGQQRVGGLNGRDSRIESTLLLEHESDVHLQAFGGKVLHALLECAHGRVQEALDQSPQLFVDALVDADRPPQYPGRLSRGRFLGGILSQSSANSFAVVRAVSSDELTNSKCWSTLSRAVSEISQISQAQDTHEYTGEERCRGPFVSEFLDNPFAFSFTTMFVCR